MRGIEFVPEGQAVVDGTLVPTSADYPRVAVCASPDDPGAVNITFEDGCADSFDVVFATQRLATRLAGYQNTEEFLMRIRTTLEAECRALVERGVLARVLVSEQPNRYAWAEVPHVRLRDGEVFVLETARDDRAPSMELDEAALRARFGHGPKSEKNLCALRPGAIIGLMRNARGERVSFLASGPEHLAERYGALVSEIEECWEVTGIRAPGEPRAPEFHVGARAISPRG